LRMRVPVPVHVRVSVCVCAYFCVSSYYTHVHIQVYEG